MIDGHGGLNLSFALSTSTAIHFVSLMERHKRLKVMGLNLSPSKAMKVLVQDFRYLILPPSRLVAQCPVERLPPEVLAFIFELGTRAEVNGDDREGKEDNADEEHEDKEHKNKENENKEHGDVDKSDDESLRIPGSFTDEPDDTMNIDTEKIRSLQLQVRMSHVNRRWRQVALNTSVLWTRVDFSEPYPFEKSQIWISRSGKRPLDLELDFTFPVEELEPLYARVLLNAAAKNLTCILDLIIPHVSRWRTFHLTTSLYKHMFSVLRRLDMCPRDPGARLLRSLILCCKDSSDAKSDSTRFTFHDYSRKMMLFGGHAPQLSHVRLFSVHLDWVLFIPLLERSAASLNAPPSVTTNLTEFDLNLARHKKHKKGIRPSYEEIVNIIRCAPNLISLKLFGTWPAPRRPRQPLKAVCLPNLQHLALGSTDENYAISLLQLFYTPSLTRISLQFVDDDYADFVAELASLMPLPDPLPESLKGKFIHPERRLANVTEANLDGILCAATSAYIFYSNCQNLQRLRLNMKSLPYNFFSILTQKDKAPPMTSTDPTMRTSPMDASRRGRGRDRGEIMCEKLESLTIFGVSGRELKKFVKKRRALGLPIRELVLDVCDVSETHLAWLERNVSKLEYIEFTDMPTLDDDEEDQGSESDEDEDESSASDSTQEDDEDESSDY